MTKNWSRFIPLCTCLCLVAVLACRTARAEDPAQADGFVRLSNATLEDKIRGGMLAQILGNLNGLPHEFKYIAEPGNVENYTPSLPDGARTDDDTDLEWVVVTEIQRTGDPLLPPSQVGRLWKTHINRGIWCANRYARDLMDLGLEPPLTGSRLINPWATFNISGQFNCESFGLMSPAMPQTAARLGLNYTHVTIDGEPAQATQLFTAMIAVAFVTDDLQRILDAGQESIDPKSRVAEIVSEVRRLHAEQPDDWRATRKAIQERWQTHGGSFRDQNGCELNTAATVAALLYGNGDPAETMRTAFNLGWDCDNNAATSATIAGVIKGRAWMNRQGWQIKDVYTNTTRDKMPNDETITGFEDRVIECAKLVIAQQGGKTVDEHGETVYLIRRQKPANVESLVDGRKQRDEFRAGIQRQLEQDLNGDSTAQAPRRVPGDLPRGSGSPQGRSSAAVAGRAPRIGKSQGGRSQYV